MQRSTILASVLLALSVTAYRHSESIDSGVLKYAAVCNEIGYRLQRAQTYQPGNRLFSPYGVSTVLSAIYEGAEGSSRQEIGRLGYSDLEQQGVDISKSYQQLRSYLQRGFGGSRLEEATVLLYSFDYSVSPSYREVLESSYSCLVKQVDYSQGNGAIYKEATGWIQEQTNGKITYIRGLFDASSGISVLSGIYFQGEFYSESRQGQQQVRQFQNEDERSQQSVLYHETESRYLYYQDEELQAVQLPYQGGEYSLLVVRPSQKTGIGKVQQQVSNSTIQNIISRSQMMQVRVSIPQFRLDYSRDLQYDIKSLGLTSIFGSGAQLSGVSASGIAHVEQITQKALIQVGKDGGQRQYHYEFSQDSQHGSGQGDQYQYEYQQGQDSQYGQEYGYQDSKVDQYGLHVNQDGGQNSYRVGQWYQNGNLQEGGFGYPSAYQGSEGVPLFHVVRPFLFYVIHNPTGLNVLAGSIIQT